MAKNRQDSMNALMVEAARAQLAALNAGIVFWRGWVEGADAFAQTMNAQLTRLVDGGSSADDALLKATDASREFLRKLTELPSTAAARFDAEFSRSANRRKKPKRRARAKS